MFFLLAVLIYLCVSKKGHQKLPMGKNHENAKQSCQIALFSSKTATERLKSLILCFVSIFNPVGIQDCISQVVDPSKKQKKALKSALTVEVTPILQTTDNQVKLSQNHFSSWDPLDESWLKVCPSKFGAKTYLHCLLLTTSQQIICCASDTIYSLDSRVPRMLVGRLHYHFSKTNFMQSCAWTWTMHSRAVGRYENPGGGGGK